MCGVKLKLNDLSPGSYWWPLMASAVVRALIWRYINQCTIMAGNAARPKLDVPHRGSCSVSVFGPSARRDLGCRVFIGLRWWFRARRLEEFVFYLFVSFGSELRDVGLLHKRTLSRSLALTDRELYIRWNETGFTADPPEQQIIRLNWPAWNVVWNFSVRVSSS